MSCSEGDCLTFGLILEPGMPTGSLISQTESMKNIAIKPYVEKSHLQLSTAWVSGDFYS